MNQTLEGSLILRSLSEGHASDQNNIAAFYQQTFGEAGNDDPIALREWATTLASGTHPTTTLDDIWVVVDPAKEDQIVSALLLIPQTWYYDGLPVQVGRVELVATHKEYRRRGLIRAQMEVAHERSLSLGHHMQAITGIGHYYRRFGYTMAVDLGSRNTLPLFAIPDLKPEEQPKYSFRLAIPEDAAQLTAWDHYRARTSRLSAVRPPEQWHFEITGRHDDEVWKTHIFIIVNSAGEDVGYFMMRAIKEERFYGCMSYVVGEKASYLETWGDVTRHMKAFANEFYQNLPDVRPYAILFDSGMPETIDTLIQATPGGRHIATMYAWYLRVEDTGSFMKYIAPVLEQRLVDSGANRYTGRLMIEFFDLTGLEMVFEQGKLVEAVQRPFEQHDGDAGFPYHTFLNLVFGHRSQQELQQVLPEAGAVANARVLLNILFPKQRSWLNALG